MTYPQPPTGPALPAAPAHAVVRDRRGARVLVIDAAHRVLLLRGHDPARPHHRYWFTPGGGLAPDEEPADGAVRELAEEIGLRVAASVLGPPVWQETVEFPFDGQWYRQQQQFFLLRVPAWQVDTSGFDEVERRTIDAHRWWSEGELAATGERIYPPELLTVLRRLPDRSDSC
ncbi:NUDIX domain-containing protein [Solwaraspora sp. WMMD791]|uniref:NUDIX hydrolase n=1 Tax=Solwaraspora sp. WMMD791 TaxID=3016086 RepID=UPI0032B4E738